MSLLQEPLEGVDLEHVDTVAKGVTGSRIEIRGLQRLRIQCGEMTDTQEFLIASLGIEQDGILGLDAIEKWGLVIDGREGLVRRGSTRIAALEVKGCTGRTELSIGLDNDCIAAVEKGPPRDEAFAKEGSRVIVKVASPVTLAPRSQTLVECRVTAHPRMGQVLIEPDWVDQGLWRAARIIGRVENGIIRVPCVNVSDFPVYLEKSQRLGVAEPYEEVRVMAVDKSEEEATVNGSELQRLLDEKLVHLSGSDAALIKAVVQEYRDVFQDPGSCEFGCTSEIKHRIDTGNAKPLAKVPYRVPYHQRKVLDELVQDMLKKGIITPSDSPWSAPVVLVKKKTEDGSEKYRFCTDFRGLNAVTRVAAYPLPNINETLEGLGKSRFFTTLDLASGYHQVAIDPGDQHKTGFSVPGGHYQYTRMAFGLAGAPATFQLLMDRVLSGLNGIMCFVYLDDVIVHSTDVPQHRDRLQLVLQKLREANLKVNVAKCQFATTRVKYLGHIVSREGVHPDPGKVSAIRSYKRPGNVKEVRAFLGLVGYYRRYVNNFADRARPLTQLTKKERPFTWGVGEENAFIDLRDAICADDVLVYPDFTLPFILSVDASGTAVGAVLSQNIDGGERPIAYASRQLNSAERNYTATERELLAAVWATKHFRCYLYGRKFVLLTDHQALRWLLTVKDPSSRLSRWQQRLAEFDYEPQYKPGKNHSNADALSRYVGTVRFREGKWDMTALRTAQEADAELKEIQRRGGVQLEKDDRGLMYVKDSAGSGWKLYVPAEARGSILEWGHKAPFSGHGGVDRTTELIKETYFWPGLKNSVREYVERCPSCLERKSPAKGIAPLGEVRQPSQPFEVISVDMVGPLPRTSRGHKYMLTCIDHLSRYAEVVPMTGTAAHEVAVALVDRVITRHGTPQYLLTDQGANFTSEIIKSLCTLMGVKKIQTSAYHPQSNGRVERFHRTINTMLSNYVRKDGTDWDKWLPLALMAYNATPHSATGYTPNYLVFGREIPKPSPFRTEPDFAKIDQEDYIGGLSERLQEAYREAREESQRCWSANAKQYNKRAREANFSMGQWVYLHCPAVPAGQAKKFYRPWKGPFRIMKVPSPLNAEIELDRGLRKVVHFNRLKPCKISGDDETTGGLPPTKEQESELVVDPPIDFLYGPRDCGANPEGVGDIWEDSSSQHGVVDIEEDSSSQHEGTEGTWSSPDRTDSFSDEEPPPTPEPYQTSSGRVIKPPRRFSPSEF